MKKSFRILAVLLMFTLLVPVFGLSAFAASVIDCEVDQDECEDPGGDSVQYSFTIDGLDFIGTYFCDGNDIYVYPCDGYELDSWKFTSGSGNIVKSNAYTTTKLTVTYCTPGSVIRLTTKVSADGPEKYKDPDEGKLNKKKAFTQLSM